MSNYNTKLQSNNIDLQAVIQTLQNKAVNPDTTDATATANDILSGKTAYANGQKITGNIAFAPARTITPSATSQTAISAGYYAQGNITVVGDVNLAASNIKKGTSIFGVNGSYEGSGETDYSVEDGLVNGTISVCMNDRITNIKSYAFYDCGSLISISFPVCTYIGESAFYSCTSLTSAIFPACSYIENDAFNYCTSLISISFPVCTSMGRNAFFWCGRLTSVNFPVCTRIGNFAFHLCQKLASVSFPICGVIESAAFGQCIKLTSVNFPACSYIGEYAFQSCSKLISADFGDNSTVSKCTIYTLAFASCKTLTNLTLRYSFVVTLSNINAFTSTPMSLSTLTGSFGSIYVPASLIASYKSATNWATYANRIVALKYIGLLQSNFTKNIYDDQNIELNDCFAYTGYDTIPTITVSQVNNLLTNISLVFNNDGIGTITAVSTGVVGTEMINISYTDPDTNKQKIVSIELEIYSAEPMTYTVTRVAGTKDSYNFVKNANGFYESNNKGDTANSSYVLCQVSVTNTASVSRELTIEYINFAESNFDYGVFYNLDLATAPTGASAGNNVYKSCKGKSVADIKTLTYMIPTGTHTFYVKYLKDGSSSQNNDSLQFRLIDCEEI